MAQGEGIAYSDQMDDGRTRPDSTLRRHRSAGSMANLASMIDVEAFLQRLGVKHQAPPSSDQLSLLHRAFVERVPYETLHIHLGRYWGGWVSTDPVAAARRIVEEHRGGYCYHLNGAFALLLTALGYQVRRQMAATRLCGEDRFGPWGDHLALTVHGLPAPDNTEGGWFVDVGLGDALHGPLPLYPGVHRDRPWAFTLDEIDAGMWRFSHHDGGSFAAIQWRPWADGDQAILDMRHRDQSGSSHSGFVTKFTAQRRHEEGATILYGCTLRTISAAPVATVTTIETKAEWFTVLADEFGLTLDGVPVAAREALWADVRGRHELWSASAPH
jgi:arylamine N-acetyltransferase